MVVSLAGLLADFWLLASVLLDASFSAPRSTTVALNGLVGSNTYCLIQLNATCYDSPMATTLSTNLQTLSLQTLANGHGGGTLVRAADGSWAPYGGVGDSAEAEALKGEGNELMKKGDIESVKGAVAKYEEAARVCDEPAAGWGPRNAFSFASAPAGAAKHGVSASVILG